jgi:hypothetical protein
MFCCDTGAEDDTNERKLFIIAKKKADHEQEIFHHSLRKSGRMNLYMGPQKIPPKLDSITEMGEEDNCGNPRVRVDRNPMSQRGTKRAYTTAATRKNPAPRNGLLDGVLGLHIPPSQCLESVSHHVPDVGVGNHHGKRLAPKGRHEENKEPCHATQLEKRFPGEHNKQSRDSHDNRKTPRSMDKSLNPPIHRYAVFPLSFCRLV